MPSGLVISAVMAGALVLLCIGSLSGPRCQLRISYGPIIIIPNFVKCRDRSSKLNIFMFSMFCLKNAGLHACTCAGHCKDLLSVLSRSWSLCRKTVWFKISYVVNLQFFTWLWNADWVLGTGFLCWKMWNPNRQYDIPEIQIWLLCKIAEWKMVLTELFREGALKKWVSSSLKTKW